MRVNEGEGRGGMVEESECGLCRWGGEGVGGMMWLWRRVTRVGLGLSLGLRGAVDAVDAMLEVVRNAGVGSEGFWKDGYEG